MNILYSSLVLSYLHLAHCSLLRQNILYSTLDRIGNSLNVTNITTAPDWGLDIDEITHKHGYRLDTHEVTTEDGYILKLYRLSHRSENISNSTKPVVFLMHALSTTARIWVYIGPKSLGYALVDAGYDVWMGNARGTMYGRKHVKLDPNNDPDFWNFSFDEVGYYDLPAMIDFVLRETRTQKLIFIGHSQGNTAFFDMASRRPEYNKKIKVAAALGPTVFITGTRYKILLTFATFIFDLLGLQELFRPGPLVPRLGRMFCSRKRYNPCILILQVAFGYSPLDNPLLMSMATSTGPQGFSTKMILHYYQLMISGAFKRYDYGFIENKVRYGEYSAPDIDLSKVTAPVALFHAPNDIFGPMRKINQLINVLPNVQMVYEIKNKYFNHVDFVFAEGRDVLLHEPLINYLESIKNEVGG